MMQELSDNRSPQYWDKVPEELIKLTKYQHTRNGLDTLEYFNGIFGHNSNCIIREFSSKYHIVRKLAEKEQEVIRRARALLIRDNVIGYYFIDHEHFSIYVLISNSYPISLLAIVNENEDEKLRVFSSLSKIVDKLNSQNLNYLLLNPETIYIKEFEVILGDFFLSSNLDNDEDVEILTNSLKLVENSFFSSEMLLVKSGSMTNNEEILKIYKLSDLYSLGIISFFIYNIKPQDISINLSDAISLRSFINFNTLKYKNLITNEFFTKTKNLKLTEIIYSMINYCFDYEYLFSCFNHYELKLFKSIEVENGFNPSNEYQEIIGMFQNLQKDIFSFRLTSDIFFQRLKNNCLELLDKKYEILENSKNIFLNTHCFTQKLNILDGILHFIWVFLKDMIESDQLRRNFHFSILSKENIRYFNYIDRFDTIQYYPHFLQDYILIGLTVQTYNRDWNFFFHNDILLTKLFCCYSLVHCENFLNICKKLLMHTKVLEILKNYVNPESRESITQIIFNHALPHTYIIPLQPSLHGLTTYNLNIFLTIYDASSVTNAAPRYLVAWFLTLFHEMAYFLRRFDCSDFLESKLKFTPRDDLPSFNTQSLADLTENLIHEKNLRGESGKQAEDLFWMPQESVNDSAAKYFLKGKFDSKKFMEKFIRKNMKPLPHLGLTKHRSEVICFRDKVCGVCRR